MGKEGPLAALSIQDEGKHGENGVESADSMPTPPGFECGLQPFQPGHHGQITPSHCALVFTSLKEGPTSHVGHWGARLS